MKTRTTGGIKILFVIIVIGAILGSTAPFIHILYPKTTPDVIALNKSYDEGKISKDLYLIQKKELKEKYKVFGFTNKRRFLFAIGLPIALFVCSFILLYLSRFISEKSAKKGSIIAGITFQFTSIYFVAWVLWPYTYEERDFSKSAYYLVIVLSSILITITLFQFQKSLSNYNTKIRELIHFIVGTRKKLFSTIEKHEPKNLVEEQKKEFDQKMYDAFEKVVD
ncbi:hypothetical protein [Aquimarina sp. SS2-1]|uniref:hypothetical protein n=1 Tax=Aquimarina besae TaxID=3342247 RepID=UPI00366D5D2F